MAYPILPEERLLMKRTGSIGSRVGPAVTTILTRLTCPAPRGETLREKRCHRLSTSGRDLRNRRRAFPLPVRQTPLRECAAWRRFPASQGAPTFFHSSPER